MRDWLLENSSNEVVVTCGEPYHNRKKIYPDPEAKARIEFWLLYNDQGKTVGYNLKYKNEHNYPLFATYNTFGIIYNRKEKSSYTFEIIFEDANVRLITYEHGHGVRDYVLIGRWRKEEKIHV